MDLALALAIAIFSIGIFVIFLIGGFILYIEKWKGTINCPCRNQGKKKHLKLKFGKKLYFYSVFSIQLLSKKHNSNIWRKIFYGGTPVSINFVG